MGQARLLNMGYKNNCVFTYQDKHFKETRFLYADACFLTMFSFPFEEGDPATALSQPYSAVISESTVRKLFGNQNPIGQRIRMDDDDRNLVICTVTGVFKDIPENSHIKFNILFSYSTLESGKNAQYWFENNWDRKNFYTYILLRPLYQFVDGRRSQQGKGDRSAEGAGFQAYPTHQAVPDGSHQS
jgi:putative ABC transport system permease protein